MKLKYEVSGITGSVIRTKTMDPLVVTITIEGHDHDLGKEKIEMWLSKKFLTADKVLLIEINDL